MARLSKRYQPFTIYDDTGIPTPEAEYQPSFDEAIEEHIKDEATHARGLSAGDETDDERRQSAFTQASVSTLPESAYNERQQSDFKPYTPPVIRPSFRRPESVRRMQMSSPPRSPRQSVLRHPRSRAGTPQSLHSVNTRGSPRSRRIISEESEEEESKHYPLVLLHLTILPVRLPWSASIMHELVPPATIEDLRLLQSKVTPTVQHRGVLIPHPREEYELLEERLLEALELQEERITACGHFRRPSVSDDEADNDSALGSEKDSSSLEEGLCDTCHIRIKTAAAAKAAKWSVKIFASNGLMRAAAWSAAWMEMERVDVEIVPWINEDLRRELDSRQALTDAEEAERREYEQTNRLEDEAHIRQLFEEQVLLAHERAGRQVQSPASMIANPSRQQHSQLLDTPSPPSFASEPRKTDCASEVQDLPPIYRPSQIPLSVLLKNYIYLLAQDRRNVAIFFLGLLALCFGLRHSSSPSLPSGATRNVTTCGPDFPSILTTPPKSAHDTFEAVGSALLPSMNAVESVMDMASESNVTTAESYLIGTQEKLNDNGSADGLSNEGPSASAVALDTASHVELVDDQ